MGSLDRHFLSPSFTWTVHTIWMPGINLRDDTQATDDPMAQPLLGVLSWLPWVLLPRESWCWVVPRQSTAWLYLFPYKRLQRSTSEVSKGNVLSYYCNLLLPEIWNEYCIPGRAMRCTPQSLLQRNLRCSGEAAAYIARHPSHFGGLWRAFFSHTSIFDAVFVPYVRQPRLR